MPYSENFDEDAKIEWLETLWQGWHEDRGIDEVDWETFDQWVEKIQDEDWDTSYTGYWAGFLEEMGLRDPDDMNDVGDTGEIAS